MKHFQIRHGLDASGKLGPQTITELNRPMSERVEQLAVDAGALPLDADSFAQPPIMVNIPEFVLRAYDSLDAPEARADDAGGRGARPADADASARRRMNI